MSTDKRVERHTQSLLALQELLKEVLSTPSHFYNNKELYSALKSQGALSKYEDKARGVEASSLNTLKRICARGLPGGFDALDRLRATALQAVEQGQQKTKQSLKVTRIDKGQRNNELETQCQTLQEELLLLNYLLEKSLRQARNYAEQTMDKNTLFICEREQKEIRAYLTLSTHSLISQAKKETIVHG